MMRAFFAVELPESVREKVVSHLETVRRALPPARWVRPQGLHVTLKFLGEQPPELVEALGREAAAALREVEPVTVALAGGGFFPSSRRPRVVWLGGKGDGLVDWAQRLEQCARRHGVPGEDRAFALHLTLARLDRPWPTEAVELFQQMVGQWRFEPFLACEAVLFRSELAPGGARYTVLRRLPVGGE